MSADDDDILYITSSRRHVIQKVELTTNTTYTILARAGRGRRDNGANIEAAFNSGLKIGKFVNSQFGL